MKATLLVEVGAKLGEGPVWWEDALWFVDIQGKWVGRCVPGKPEVERYPVGQRVGAMVPRQQGGWVLAMQNGFAYFHPESGAMQMIADPEADFPGNRFNDGKCDPRGRFVAGTMGLRGEPKLGSLYALEPDGSTRRLWSEISISNGLAWTEDGETLYYIDTPTKQVVEFRYDLDSGSLHDRRVVVSVPEGMGGPDGMTIDRAGNLWVALWGGWGVGCWDPRTGELLQKIEVPVSNVTACTFGGRDFDRLYITSAGGGAEKPDPEQPHAGSLFVAEPGVSGFPPFAFAG